MAINFNIPTSSSGGNHDQNADQQRERDALRLARLFSQTLSPEEVRQLLAEAPTDPKLCKRAVRYVRDHYPAGAEPQWMQDRFPAERQPIRKYFQSPPTGLQSLIRRLKFDPQKLLDALGGKEALLNQRDDDGRTLLHLVCGWESTSCTFLARALFRACPELLHTQDLYGNYPFDLIPADQRHLWALRMDTVFRGTGTELEHMTLSYLCSLPSPDLAVAYAESHPWSLLNTHPNRSHFLESDAELPLAVCARLGKWDLARDLLDSVADRPGDYVSVALSRIPQPDFDQVLEHLGLVPEHFITGLDPLLMSHPLLVPVAEHWPKPDNITPLVAGRLAAIEALETDDIRSVVSRPGMIQRCFLGLFWSPELDENIELATKLYKELSKENQSTILSFLLDHYSPTLPKAQQFLDILVQNYKGELLALGVHNSTLVLACSSDVLRDHIAPKLTHNFPPVLWLAHLSEGITAWTKKRALSDERILELLDILLETGVFGKEGEPTTVEPLDFLRSMTQREHTVVLEWALKNLSCIREAVPLRINTESYSALPLQVEWPILHGFQRQIRDLRLQQLKGEQYADQLKRIRLLLPYSRGILSAKATSHLRVTEVLLLSGSLELIKDLIDMGVQMCPAMGYQLMRDVLEGRCGREIARLPELVACYEAWHPGGKEAVEKLPWREFVQVEFSKEGSWPALAKLANRYPKVKALVRNTGLAGVVVTPKRVKTARFMQDLEAAMRTGARLYASHMDLIYEERPWEDVLEILNKGYGVLSAREVPEGLANGIVDMQKGVQEKLTQQNFSKAPNGAWVMSEEDGIQLRLVLPVAPKGWYLFRARKGKLELPVATLCGRPDMLMDSTVLAEFQKCACERIYRSEILDAIDPVYYRQVQGDAESLLTANDAPTLPLHIAFNRNLIIKTSRDIDTGQVKVEKSPLRTPGLVTAAHKYLAAYEQRVNELIEMGTEMGLTVWVRGRNIVHQGDPSQPTLELWPQNGKFRLVFEDPLGELSGTPALPADAWPPGQSHYAYKGYALDHVRGKIREVQSLIQFQRGIVELYKASPSLGLVLDAKLHPRVLVHHRHQLLKERLAEANATWGCVRIGQRQYLTYRNSNTQQSYARLVGFAANPAEVHRELAEIARLAEGKEVNYDVLLDFVVNLVEAPCPEEAARINVVAAVTGELQRLFPGNQALFGQVSKVVDQIVAGNGFWGLKKDEDADRYRELQIKLSHTLKTLVEEADDDKIRSFLLELSMYHRDCGVGITQCIDEAYKRIVAKVQDRAPSAEKNILAVLVSQTLQELVNDLMSSAVHPAAHTQSRHLRNYLRRELMDMGIPLPKDPMLGDQAQDPNRDKFLEGEHVSDYPYEKLQEIFNELFLPALVKRIMDHQNKLIQREDHEGLLALQKPFKDALERLFDAGLPAGERVEELQAQLAACSSSETEVQKEAREQFAEAEARYAQLKEENPDWQLFLDLRDRQRALNGELEAVPAVDDPDPTGRSSQKRRREPDWRHAKRQRLRKELKGVNALLETLEDTDHIAKIAAVAEEQEEKAARLSRVGPVFAAKRQELLMDFARGQGGGTIEEVDVGGIDMDVLTVHGVLFLLAANNILLPVEDELSISYPSDAFGTTDDEL